MWVSLYLPTLIYTYAINKECIVCVRLDDRRKHKADFQRTSQRLHPHGQRPTEISGDRGETTGTFYPQAAESDRYSPHDVLQMEGEESGTGEIHRRGSGRGLLQADLEEDEEEGLGAGFATPPLQHSPSWSTSRSRINSYMVTTHSSDTF